jgi:hypothetical protein
MTAETEWFCTIELGIRAAVSLSLRQLDKCWLAEDRFVDAKRFEKDDLEQRQAARLRECFRENPFWRRLSFRRKQGWTESPRPYLRCHLGFVIERKTSLDNRSLDSLSVITIITITAG